MKSLYPPGDQTMIAVPDSAWHPTMRQDSRPSLSFSAHATLPANATWDCMVVMIPGDVTAAYVISAPSGTDFTSATPPANSSTQILSTLPTGVGSALLKNYCLQDRAAANGSVTGRELKACANPLRVQGFRTTYRGYTMHNTSSSLYDGGSLLAAQFACTSKDTNISFCIRDGVSRLGMDHRYSVPLTEDAITGMCPGAQIGNAKDGFFMPIRLMGPEQQFACEQPAIGRCLVPATTPTVGPASGYVATTIAQHISLSATPNTAYGWSAPSMPGWISYYGAVNSENGEGYEPWWCRHARELSGKIDDTAFDNCAHGVCIMRGLPYQASFTLQAYVGIEAVLDTSSPFRSMAQATARLDRAAMEAYYAIAASMPFVYPANYNSLALLMPFLSRAVSALAPHIKSLLPRVVPFLGNALDLGSAKLSAKTAALAVESAGAAAAEKVQVQTEAPREVIVYRDRPGPTKTVYVQSRQPRVVSVGPWESARRPASKSGSRKPKQKRGKSRSRKR